MNSVLRNATFRPALWKLTTLVCLALAHGPAMADDSEEKIYTDPNDVPELYQLQGEYTGIAGEESGRFGAQVIALGNDEFELVGYAGGLPGDGWDSSTDVVRLKGKKEGDAVTFDADIFAVELRDGALRPVTKEDGVTRGELNRTVRISPTMGAKPPEGATVLFDGTSADAFKNGKIVQGKLLLADCQSKMEFGDHTMHIEFRTPFKPKARGQARGNSGVYVQSRYEIQVLDSFGLTGETNECGGIYQVAKPRVNMCYPPLQWQTYDIDFTAARYNDSGEKTQNAKITVRHNGVVIHEDLELPKQTPGKNQEDDSPGALYLQGHGNPVVYRNIWVVSKE